MISALLGKVQKYHLGTYMLKWKQKCQSLYLVQLFVTPWTVAFVHRILQARILEWVAIPFSTGSSQCRIEPGSPVW